jgi:DNA-binding GntR family transcriptional regulator
MEVAARAADADAYHLLNLQFHDTLVEYAGNRKMGAVYRKLVKELSLFRRRNLRDQAILPHSAAEHRAILKAIASGDSEGDHSQARILGPIGARQAGPRHDSGVAPRRIPPR